MSYIICTICRDSLVPLSKFVHTKEVRTLECGHIFHKSCITNWLVRSANCPHCRLATHSLNNSLRLFFELSVDDGEDSDDVEKLKCRLIKLSGDIELLHNEAKETKKRSLLYVTKIKELNEKEDVARKEITYLTEHLTTMGQNLVSSNFKLRHLKTQVDAAEATCREQKAILKRKSYEMIKYERVKKILETPFRPNELEETKLDPHSLMIVITALKREMALAKASEFSLKKENGILNEAYQKMKKEIDAANEKISIHERVIETYKKREESQANAGPLDSTCTKEKKKKFGLFDSDSDSSDSTMNIRKAEKEGPECSKSSDSAITGKKGRTAKGALKRPMTVTRRSTRVCNIDLRGIQKKSNLVLKLPHECYNGMGGHSRADDLPKPRLRTFKINRSKRVQSQHNI